MPINDTPALDFRANRADGDDILGDAYEYLMRHFATESGKSKGQFYTPAEVSRIMAKVIGVGGAKAGDQTIYDPTCGSGSLLIKAHDEAKGLSGLDLAIYGQERDNATYALAHMNAILHDCPTRNVQKDNTLSTPHFKQPDGALRTFDFVVANPPFSDKAWSNGFDPGNDPGSWPGSNASEPSQPRQSRREMVNGESHYFQGRRYRLRVVEQAGKKRGGRVVLRNLSAMELHIHPGADAGERERIIQRWYRERLCESIPSLLATWEATLAVRATAWGIKKMKTKWGACNPDTGRIWLNLELAKKAPRCLEYIVVHELVHLLVRHHDDRFNALMDRHLPTWRARRQELNSGPLVQETWTR